MNNPFFAKNNFIMTEHHKVQVDSYLKAEDDIYVLGDNADTPYSGMAQTALYDGRFVANNLKRMVRGKSMKTYVPKKPIYVTPAGPRWAAVLWGNVRIYGWLGWMLRRAADLIAYHDYQPWWQASQLMQAERIEEEQCPLCSAEK
jgi:NADH dehydrogenase FAD-containing subunit